MKHASRVSGVRPDFSGCLQWGNTVTPFALHYGDMQTALSHLDMALDVFRRSMDEPDRVPELFSLTVGAWS